LSYVIQNFYEPNRRFTLTPRLKFFIVFNNLDKFSFYLKLNTFVNLNLRIPFLHLNPCFLFFKYFFNKLYLKLIFKTNLTLVGNYTTNLTKSYAYHIYKNLYFFFQKKFIFLEKKSFEVRYFFNIYFLTIKVINTRINNNLYKNVFFFFTLILPFLWYQHTSLMKFYLNFILISYSLKTLIFYNGPFLKIYNH
jgi:hypothetical protein